MALSIKDPATERLARELALKTGESITSATRRAIEERLRRVSASGRSGALLEDMKEIRLRWAAMPEGDKRSADDIIGYDEHGLPR